MEKERPDYSSPSLWLDLTAANDRIAELDAKINAQRDLMLETAKHLDRCAIALWDAFNGQHPDPGFLTNKAEEYKTCSFLATDLANRINRLEGRE